MPERKICFFSIFKKLTDDVAQMQHIIAVTYCNWISILFRLQYQIKIFWRIRYKVRNKYSKMVTSANTGAVLSLPE